MENNDTPANPFDELDSKYGGEQEEAEAKDFKALFLSKDKIAEIAYRPLLAIEEVVSKHEGQASWLGPWESLTDLQQKEYGEIALLAIKMQQATDEEFGRLIHSKRAMQYLDRGYRFSERHDDEKKETHLIAPWESLPYERRAGLMAFKGTVRAMFKVWDNENPWLQNQAK